MIQLLSAGFTRLIKNKLFWFGNLLMTGFFIFLLIRSYMDSIKYPDSYLYTADTLLFAPFQIIGIFSSCFTGMFLGREYSDGTLRNKLITGKSRTQIYLSNLILSFVSSLVVSFFAILAAGILGIAFWGPLQSTMTHTLLYIGLGILMLVVYSGIFTLLAMLISNRTAGTVVCIFLFFLMLIASIYINTRLEAEEFTMPGYTISVDGVLQPMDPVPNPLYLEGTARTVYEFFRELLPPSQGSMLMSHGVKRPLIQVLCTLGLTICTMISGIFHFRRKDLK